MPEKFDLFGQNVLVIVGKGGTGRTTLARALARLATRSGKKVSVIAGTSGTHSLGSDDPLLDFSSLEPGEVLISYLNDHGLGQLGKRLSATGIAGIISTAIPGIADLLVLAKIKQIEQSRVSDLIIFDAPASGHFIRLVATPKGLADIAAAGPLQKQSQDVLEMLSDPKRVGIAFVTIPEETPAKESIETMRMLKKTSGITAKALFLNSVVPSISMEIDLLNSIDSASALYNAALYTQARSKSQISAKHFTSQAFGLEPIELPLLPTVELGDNEINILANAIQAQIGAAI